jgi:hypothetical protein
MYGSRTKKKTCAGKEMQAAADWRVMLQTWDLIEEA